METADRLLKKGLEVLAPRHKSVEVQDGGEKIHSLVAKEEERIEGGSHPSHGYGAVPVVLWAGLGSSFRLEMRRREGVKAA
jgi:hypothetical protein